MPTDHNDLLRREAAIDMPTTHPPQLSFGQKLVGLTFNPSNDSKVDKAKRLFAEIADLVNDYKNEPREATQLEATLFPHTIGEILNAQMNVVKLLTLKY